MPRRLSAFMSGHPARAAGGLSCAVHWNSLEQCGIGFRAGERKPGHARRPPSFPGESARWLHRRGMRAGGDDGIRASLLPRGGETASDDVAAAGDLPVPATGRAVRENVVRKYGILGPGYGIQGLGFEQQHDTSPAWARHPDPRAARRQVNARRARSPCSKLLKWGSFLWSKLLTLEFLSATAFRAERHPTMRSGPRDLRCS
jgi:hypothetical protein